MEIQPIQPAKIGFFNPIIMNSKSKGIWGLAENARNMLELWGLSTTNIQQPRVNRMDSYGFRLASEIEAMLGEIASAYRKSSKMNIVASRLRAPEENHISLVQMYIVVDTSWSKTIPSTYYPNYPQLSRFSGWSIRISTSHHWYLWFNKWDNLWHFSNF